MALALDDVDGHQKVQVGKCRIEFRPVGPGHDRVAAVDHHRADLTAARGGDLVGQFTERVRADHHLPSSQPAAVRFGLDHVDHAQGVDVTTFEPPSARPVHASGDHVQNVTQPLGDGARLVQRDTGPGDDHRAACGGEIPCHPLDVVPPHVAAGGQVVQIGVGDQCAQLVHSGGQVAAVLGVLEPLVEDDLRHRQQERPVLARPHGEVHVRLLRGLGAHRVDDDNGRAALLPLQRTPPAARHGLQPVPRADRRVRADQQEVVALVDVGHRRHEL